MTLSAREPPERTKAEQRAPPTGWRRLPREGPRAYAAFQRYRDAGAERSIAKVGQALGKSRGLMERWSQRWKWVQRAKAWDDELDRRSRERIAKALSKGRETAALVEAAFAQRQLRALSIPAEVSLQRIAEDPTARAELQAMPLPDLLRLVGSTTHAGRQAVLVHRMAFGLSVKEDSSMTLEQGPSEPVVKLMRFSVENYPEPEWKKKEREAREEEENGETSA